MSRSVLTFSIVALFSLGAVGCEFLDASILLDTGPRSIVMDANALNVKIPGGSASIPKIKCTKDATCNVVPGLKCGGGAFTCAVKCVSGFCGFVATAEQSTKVDVTEKLNNAGLAGAISKVSFEYMRYEVKENSFSFDTPQLGLYIGPDAAKNTSAGGVSHFATMPKITRGTKPSAKMDATAAGKNALQDAIKNAHNNPFRFFGKAGLTFKGGDKLPTGKMVLEINAFFKIDPI